MTTIETMLEYLAQYGGKIVSTNSLTPEWINQARVSDRLYVDQNSLGYVWEPDIKKMPTNEEEVKFFERWYPLEIEIPDELKDSERFFREMQQRVLEKKQTKEN